MLNKKKWIIYFLLPITYCQPQIGIQTDNPQSLFHIDSQVNNVIAPVNTTYMDDIVFSSAGTIGIGTITPVVKLDINTGGTAANPISGFKLTDGNEGVGRLLLISSTAVANKATWNIYESQYSSISGVSKLLNLVTSQVFYYTGHSFALKDKGTYLITIGAQLSLYSDDKDLLGRLRIPIQMKPTNNPGDWSNSSQRFSGAYEAYPTQGIPILEVNDPQGKYILDFRYYINQAITSEIDNQVVYLLLWTSEPVNIQATLTLGETGAQGSGGAYVKIN